MVESTTAEKTRTELNGIALVCAVRTSAILARNTAHLAWLLAEQSYPGPQGGAE
ncbi:hypothetical protein [Nocardia sp. NPDC051981]|uniref:hypothetical protein n=1 Tax=Nocardia sp. NPDC051981 TaxID=3155417 RepID=UPI003441BDAD